MHEARYDEPEIEIRVLDKGEAAAIALVELWAADLAEPAANDFEEDETPTSHFVVPPRALSRASHSVRPALAPTRLCDDGILDAWLRAG